jgi:hypothetical protein
LSAEDYSSEVTDKFENQRTQDMISRDEGSNEISKIHNIKESGHTLDPKVGETGFRIRRSIVKVIDTTNNHASAYRDPYFSIDFEDGSPSEENFDHEKSIANEVIKESTIERIEKDRERKKMIEKLKRKIQNDQKQNGLEEPSEDELFKKLQSHILLISKYPKIKDPNKKIKVKMFDFKFTSLNDVKKQQELQKQDIKMSNWDRIWKDSNAKQYEKKFKFLPQDDINVIVNTRDHEASKNKNTNRSQSEDDYKNAEYVSRNDILQEKYNEYFRSNIIATGTVSVVVNSRNRKEVDRKELHEFRECITSEDSNISSEEEKEKQSIVRIVSDSDSFEESVNKEESLASVPDVK